MLDVEPLAYEEDNINNTDDKNDVCNEYDADSKNYDNDTNNEDTPENVEKGPKRAETFSGFENKVIKQKSNILFVFN